MAARPQLAPILVLALVLVVGLAGIFLWGGFGTGESLPDDPGTTTSQTPGYRNTDAGSLKADAGVEGNAPADSDRENIQPAQVSGRGRLELTGRLVHSDGTPGAGLKLRYLQFDGGSLFRGARIPNMADAPAIQTDAEGRFQLDAKAESMVRLSLDDTATVFKNGARRGMVVQVGKQSKDLGDVVILASARVSGQVVDSSGQPVPGVSVVAGRSSGDLWGLALGRGNKTDKDGRFDLVGLRPGKQQLHTRSPEHLPAEQGVELGEGQHRKGIIIQVQPGGYILGTVVDDLGQPVPDADVAASRTRQVDTQIKITAFSPGESTRTDRAGRFRLANLSTKKATLRVTKTGLDEQMVPDVTVGTTDLVVELKRLGAIEGVVVDEKNRPVQGSIVSAGGDGMYGLGHLLPGGLRRSGTVTNAAGTFRLENVQSGRVVVTARSDSHLPARERVQVRPAETTKDVRLVATPGTTLEVTVRDAAGQPVANATVTVTVREKGSDSPLMLPARGGGRADRRVEYRTRTHVRGNRDGMVFLGDGKTLGEGKTDARGKVTIGGLPGGDVLVGAKHEELALVEPQELVLPGRGKATALLNMCRGGFLLVSAVDAAGKPVANAKFKVRGPTAGKSDGEDAESRDERCDGDGKARVGPLSAGDYAATLVGEPRPRVRGGMSISWAGSEPSLDDSRVTLQVREGGTTEIVLRKPVLTTVRGSVRDRTGPVKGAQVGLTKEGDFRHPMGNGLEALTDEDGRFEIAGVPSGKYTLTWGRRSAVVPAQDEVQLQKNQAELVRHLVIPGAVVKLLAWNAEDAEPVEDAEVTLSRIRASAPGQGPQPRRRTRFAMISITNRGSGPKRVDMSGGDPSAHTDEDGMVVIKDVPPGKYALSIKHRRFATHREQIEILADATLDLGTKKLTSGGSVSGSILFEDTDQMRMALVQLTTFDGKNTERTVATNGRFRFSGLATGKYKVRAQRVGSANLPWGPEEIVEVKPGRTARTKLALP